MKNLEKSVHEKTLHKRRGLILIAAYILIEVALFAGSQIGHIRCLHILATLLTPLAFFYINATCFGGIPVWSGKRWAVVATGVVVLALGLGLLM